MPDPIRVGLLSDIHGNYTALQAVLDDMETVDDLVCAGDIVGYGPRPEACLTTIRKQDVPSVIGNHDRAVAEGWNYESGDRYAGHILDDEQREWLGNRPRKQHLFEERLTVVHDHPEHQDRYTYPAEFNPALLDGEDALVLGHTHVQHAETFEDGIVVNPGSVGQPRDGNPDAAYAILDFGEQNVELHRVEYDIQQVQTRIRNTNRIDNRNATRLADGR